jgi:hypothetical protein
VGSLGEETEYPQPGGIGEGTEKGGELEKPVVVHESSPSRSMQV